MLRDACCADPRRDHASGDHGDNLHLKISDACCRREGLARDRGDGERRQADEQVDANCAVRKELEDGDEERKAELRAAEADETPENSDGGTEKCRERAADR